VAGFVLVFGSGTDYDSENYRWFSRRYPDGFHYLDRIVLDERFRRRGLGRRVYGAVEADAAAHGRLVLEVNLEPPNDPSLAFHRARGFVEVGRLANGGKVVALMEKQIG
jgi:predicted GNAT superfamily acetyltransferase